MKPTIGRIVHYKTFNATPEVWPAIINHIYDDGRLGIWVFSSDGGFQAVAKSMAAGPTEAEPSQWWWPERV